MTEGSVTPIMAREHAATQQGNAVTAPHKRDVDLGWTFYLPVIYRLCTGHRPAVQLDADNPDVRDHTAQSYTACTCP